MDVYVNDVLFDAVNGNSISYSHAVSFPGTYRIRVVGISPTGHSQSVTRTVTVTGGIGPANPTFIGEGREYEQTFRHLINHISPRINHVNVGAGTAVRSLNVSGVDCRFDPRSNPFLFFNTREGTFENYRSNADGTASVDFRANQGTSTGQRWVEVGLGDSLGRVGRRTVWI